MATKKQTTLKQITQVLKDEYSPTRLFLFGSQSNGSATIESDYDFVLVIPKSSKSRLSHMSQARELLHKKCGISADVFVYSQKEFDEEKYEFSSIAETALNTGKEIKLD